MNRQEKDVLDIQKEREAFEIHCHENGFDNEKDAENFYIDDCTNAAWCGWIDCARDKQAEIDALKAKLCELVLKTEQGESRE